MQKALLLLLGGSCLAIPVAAQTVAGPSSQKTAAAANPERAVQDAAELRTVDKLRAVNSVGTNGYDVLAFDERLRPVLGTPFLVPGWAKGDVTLGANGKPVPAVLKFDIVNQELRVLRPQGDSIILAPEQLRAFTLTAMGPQGQPEARRFERLPGGLVPDVAVGYAENISATSELQLLKFQQKIILKTRVGSSYEGNAPAHAFQTKTQYFLRWADGTCVPVKPSRNSLLAAVASRHAALAAAEMQDNTKVRSDSDLAALVQRVNTGLAGK